jgi:tetratricopeptide (TPR) repeat protein
MLLVATAASLALTAPVGAQPVPSPAEPAPTAPGDLAVEHATRAKRFFDQGEYEAAVDAYLEAYRLRPSPGLLYNLGQAYRLVGRCADAVEAYRDYLHLVPDSPYADTVRQNLTAAEVCVREAEAAQPEPARRDPVEPGPTPPPPPPTPALEPPIAAVPSAGTPSPAARRMRIAGLATAGAGVALLGAGAYFAFDARRASDDVSAFYQQGGAWDQIADTDARGRRSRTLALVAMTGGTLAVAGGATLYLVGRRKERTSLVVAPRAGGGEVVVSWRF